MGLDLPQNIKIGWIGTGVMGRSMFGHILDKGYKGFVYTRTKDKASSLLEKGAIWCGSAGEVAAHADIVFTMVGTPADVHEVYLSRGSLIDSAKPGSVLVDMTTTSPSLAVEIYERSGKKIFIRSMPRFQAEILVHGMLPCR